MTPGPGPFSKTRRGQTTRKKVLCFGPPFCTRLREFLYYTTFRFEQSRNTSLPVSRQVSRLGTIHGQFSPWHVRLSHFYMYNYSVSGLEILEFEINTLSVSSGNFICVTIHKLSSETIPMSRVSLSHCFADPLHPLESLLHRKTQPRTSDTITWRFRPSLRESRVSGSIIFHACHRRWMIPTYYYY